MMITFLGSVHSDYDDNALHSDYDDNAVHSDSGMMTMLSILTLACPFWLCNAFIVTLSLAMLSIVTLAILSILTLLIDIKVFIKEFWLEVTAPRFFSPETSEKAFYWSDARRAKEPK